VGDFLPVGVPLLLLNELDSKVALDYPCDLIRYGRGARESRRAYSGDVYEALDLFLGFYYKVSSSWFWSQAGKSPDNLVPATALSRIVAFFEVQREDTKKYI